MTSAGQEAIEIAPLVVAQLFFSC